MKNNILIFLLLLSIKLSYSQDCIFCSNGYIININGKNQCIDTTDIYYFPYYYKTEEDYSSWNYTILMKIFNESKWNSRTHSEGMRILFSNINCDTIYFFSFSNLNKDSICMLRYKSTYYEAPPPKSPCGKFSKRDYPSYSTMQGGDTIYYFHYLDSTIYMTDKIRMDKIIQSWYLENYGQIDTVTYTSTEYKISKMSFYKLIKNFANLNDYNFSTAMMTPIVLIEYVINEEYQINYITLNGWYINKTLDGKYHYIKDNKSKAILKWLNKYI
jgi:hypothetical protein